MSKAPEASVAAIITLQDACGTKVLLTMRNHEPYMGYWCLPGGHVDANEPIEDAIRREVKEETGLDVKIGKPFFVDEWRPKVKGEEWQIIGAYFECFADSDDVVLSEDHDEFRWISPEDYKKNRLIENLHQAFQAFLEK